MTSVDTFAEDEDIWDIVDQGPARQSASLTGDIQSRTTMDSVADNDYEDFITSRQLVYAKGVFPISEKVSLVLSGLAEYQIRANRLWHENGARYFAEIEDFYADLHFGNVDLRLGQQIVNWGVTDVVSPTNTINSYDMNRIIDTELGHERIPNLMAKVDYYPGPAHLEALFIPFFRPAHIDFIGGDWSLLGNRFPITEVTGLLDENETGRQFLALMARYFPDWDEQLEEALSSERLNVLGPSTPADDLQHWEAGGRAGITLGPTDTSVSYFYNYDDLPSLKFNRKLMELFEYVAQEGDLPDDALNILQSIDINKVIKSEYHRVHQFGTDFEANLGPSIFRAEGAMVLGRHLYNDRLEVVEKPMATYTVAADFVLPADLNFNLQVLRADTLDWTEDLLNEQAYTFLITYLQGEFLEGKLEFYAELLYNVTAWSMDKFREGDFYNEDLQSSGKISYDVLQDLNLGIGATVFAGPEDQLLGIAHSRSFWFFDLKYSF